jgi:hypothetical protein
MKNITKLTLTLSTVVFMSACGGSTGPTPTKNSALSSVSPTSATKKGGLMQHSLDSWLEDDWTPTVEQDPTIRKKYMKPQKKEIVSKSNTLETTKDASVEHSAPSKEQEVTYVEDNNRDFTLQEYVDKAGAYMKAHKDDHTESQVEKMSSMPVIGK